MKVELESNSSDSGEVDDAHFFQKNPLLDPRRKLWTNTKSPSDTQRSGSLKSGEKKHSTQSDEDFEFVITKSSKAKKVKKSIFDTQDNKRSEQTRESRNSVNGKFEGNPLDKPREKEPNPGKKKGNRPRGHPGLEREIDFDPFDSSSDHGSVASEPYDINTYTTQNKGLRGGSDEFPPLTQEIRSVQFDTTPTVYERRRSYSLFLTKVKSFFKSVGFRIRKCYSKSRVYFSKMVKNRRQKRRNKKSREPLIRNQSYVGETESELNTPFEKSDSSREKADYPFDGNSVYSQDDQDPQKNRRRSMSRNLVTKIKSLKRIRGSGSKANLRPVKLNSFPDG